MYSTRSPQQQETPPNKLPPAPQPNPQTSPAGNANTPSLQDLGFGANQTQGSAQEQALLNKRTHMLKVHQTLGLITAIPMVATLITGPQAKAKGKNGEPITEPTDANLDFHMALGGLTTGLYFTTAYYAIFAPKFPGVKPKGAIRLHRDLAWIHGSGNDHYSGAGNHGVQAGERRRESAWDRFRTRYGRIYYGCRVWSIHCGRVMADPLEILGALKNDEEESSLRLLAVCNSGIRSD